jgi:hypothetical protein
VLGLPMTDEAAVVDLGMNLNFVQHIAFEAHLCFDFESWRASNVFFHRQGRAIALQRYSTSSGLDFPVIFEEGSRD